MRIYKDKPEEVTLLYPFCDCCDDVVYSFYTTDSANTIEFEGDYLNVSGNSVTVHFTKFQLQSLADGALHCVAKHNNKSMDIPCDVYIKTPVNYSPSSAYTEEELDEAKQEGYEEGISAVTSQFKHIKITENGNYTKETAYGAYSSITVDVKNGEARLKAITVEPTYTTESGITHFSNKTYTPEVGWDGFSSVTVNGTAIETLAQNNATIIGNQKKLEGYNSGYTKGNADGYASGKTDGYNSGYTKGNADGKTEQKATDDAALTSTITITENGTYNATYGYKQVKAQVSANEDFINSMAQNARGNFAYAVKSKSFPNLDVPTDGPYVCESTPTGTSIGSINFEFSGLHIAFCNNTSIQYTVGWLGSYEWYIYKPLSFSSVEFNSHCEAKDIYVYLDNDNMFRDKTDFDNYFRTNLTYFSQANDFIFHFPSSATLNYLPTYQEERDNDESITIGKISIVRF